MFPDNFYGIFLMTGTIAMWLLALVILVLLARLIFVATQALRSYIHAQDVRMTLLLAEPDEAPGSDAV
jgi:hypothetical protein